MLLILSVKKNNGFTDGKLAQKKFPLELYRRKFPSLIVAYVVNLFQLFVKYQRIDSVYIFIGESPMELFRR
jgi:hypothetical protein